MSILIPERVTERLFSNVTQVGDCLISLYSIGSHGYAQIGWHEGGKVRMVLCHRAAWQAHNGPIPFGMTIDHTCHERRCINIDHLRMLSNFENARRNMPNRDWPVDGRCIRGHSPDLYVRKSELRMKGFCRACRSEAAARKREQKVS